MCCCSCRAGSVLGLCANVVCLLSVMIQPYMPVVSQQIQDQLQVSTSDSLQQKERERQAGRERERDREDREERERRRERELYSYSMSLIELLALALCLRTLTFLKNNFSSTIPAISLTTEDRSFVARVTRELRGYLSCLEVQKIRDGLKHILAVSRLGNGHVQAYKPWSLIKGSADDV